MVSARQHSFYTGSNGLENSGNGWISVTRQSPCPICGKPDWCRTKDEGRGWLAHCQRADHAPPGWSVKKRAAAGLILLADNSLRPDSLRSEWKPAPKTSKRATITPEEWQRKADAHQRHSGDQLDVLAESLGVPVAALRAIGCGWDAVGGRWTFPERDGAGLIVGMATRTPDGEKRFWRGGHRGLTYDPSGWSRGDGPILLVEGASDVAAATAMGLAVIGRPSNRGGVDHLAALLASAPGRRVIVVGENDIKTDGTWPGRDGAESTARRLAETMERTVLWSVVPKGVKDAREYLRLHGAAAGGCLVDALEMAAEKIDGNRPCGVEVPPGATVEAIPDRGPVRTVEDYRAETRATFDRIVGGGLPGIFLHHGGTGSGKTTKLIESLAAIPEEDRAPLVWLMPDHANCDQKAEELREAGYPVAAYPKLDATNCRNLDEVEQAKRWGMVAGAAVCGSCPMAEWCRQSGYVALKREAEKSPAIVTTHSMAALSPKVFEGRDIVVFDERAEEALATVMATDVGRSFATVQYLLGNVTRKPSKRKNLAVPRGLDYSAVPGLSPEGAAALAGQRPKRLRDVEGLIGAPDAAAVRRHVEAHHNPATFAGSLLAVAERITAAAEGMESAGVVEVALPDPVEAPQHWQREVYDWVKHFGSSLGREDMADKGIGPVFQLLTAAATGNLAGKLWVEASERHHGGKLYCRAIGKQLNPVPKGKTVILLDADGNADHLRALSGRDVEDVTPAGRLADVQRVVQIPSGPNRTQTPDATAAAVDAVLTSRPEVMRLGVITHKNHAEEIENHPNVYPIPRRNRDRIARWCGFGTGPDRGSNEWVRECDHLAVVGLHRPPAVRQWLIVHGFHDAAALPDGKYDTIYWQGVTTDGRLAVFEGKNYRHPLWRMAADALWVAGIRQAIGRARTVLGADAGIPVTVWCDQPLGLPVDAAATLEGTPGVIRNTVTILEHAAAERDHELGSGVAESELPSKNYIGASSFPATTLTPADAVGAVMRFAGVGRRQAEKRIRAGIDAGRLERLPGRLIRVTDAPPTENRPPKSTAPGRSASWPTTDTPEQSTPLGSILEAGPAATLDPVEVEEAAAIMEIDGGLDRETAIRRARAAAGRPGENPAAPPGAPASMPPPTVEVRFAGEWRSSSPWPPDPLPRSCAPAEQRIELSAAVLLQPPPVAGWLATSTVAGGEWR
jgi:phage/plasmid primase-like uncharacterized protein